MSLQGLPGGEEPIKAKQTPPASENTAGEKANVKKEKSISVFYTADKDKSGNITANEIKSENGKSVADVLDKIKNILPEFASNNKVRKTIAGIQQIVNKLSSTKIEYDGKTNFDKIDKEVKNIQQDVQYINEITQELKDGNSKKAAEDFNNLTLVSEGAKEAVKTHNVQVAIEKAKDYNNEKKAKAQEQMKTALNEAVNIAMKTGGKVEIGDLKIETMKDLQIKKLDISSKAKLATGTKNDTRTEKGIERGVDGLVVKLTYTFEGKEYTIEQVTDKIPTGYKPAEKEDLFDEREVEITKGENTKLEWD